MSSESTAYVCLFLPGHWGPQQEPPPGLLRDREGAELNAIQSLQVYLG